MRRAMHFAPRSFTTLVLLAITPLGCADLGCPDGTVLDRQQGMCVRTSSDLGVQDVGTHHGDMGPDTGMALDQGPCPPCGVATPLCNVATMECVECLGIGDCGGDRPQCDVATGMCVACLNSTHCGGDAPVCSSGACAGECLPGTVQTAAATPSSPATCAPCVAGQHCAGGTSPAVACAAETWDHDADPATACVPWTICGGGTYMTAAGTATANRTCAGCPLGTFNPASSNVSMCTAWRECAYLENEDTPGTALADRTCFLTGAILQFGTSASDEATSISASGSSIAIAGNTYGAFSGQTNSGERDVFVQRYNSTTGTLQWTRQFGTEGLDRVFAVTLSLGDAVVLAGDFGFGDPFVRQYGADGDLDWHHDTTWTTQAVSAGGDGSVFVVGYVDGALPGQSPLGYTDAILQKYSATGVLLWTRQFGTSEPDQATAVAVGSDGTMVVVGSTYGAFPGHTPLVEADVFIRKFDADGTVLWTQQFGTTNIDWAKAVAIDHEGAVAVVGYTHAALPGQSHVGSADAFVRKYDAAGGLLWTRQFGGAGWDGSFGVSMTPNGRVLVAGGVTGALPGHVANGAADVFLVTYDPAGTLLRRRQFGTSGGDSAQAVTTTSDGRAYVVGPVQHALPGHISAGGLDAFLWTVIGP